MEGKGIPGRANIYKAPVVAKRESGTLESCRNQGGRRQVGA